MTEEKKKMSTGKKGLIGIGVYFGVGIYGALLYAFPVPALVAGVILAVLLVRFFRRNKNSQVEDIQQEQDFQHDTIDFIENAKNQSPSPKLTEEQKIELRQRLQERKSSQMDIEDVVIQGLEKRIDKSAPAGKHYTMIYGDWNGNETRREIDLQGFLYDNDKLYIIAWCYLRNAQRQFAVNRIVQLYDKNNVVISYPEQYFENMYHDTDEYKISAFFESHFDELMVLVFLARADGQMRKNEREIIADYVKQTLAVSNEAVLDNHIKSWKCEFDQFGKSLKKLKESSASVKNAVADSATKMYELKKSPDTMESAAYQKIKEILSK